MATADWRAIFTAAARSEGKTLRDWLADCDRQAAEMVAAIPPHLRKPPLLRRRDAA